MAPADADQPAAGRLEGRDHFLPVRIYYEDTDFSGLVYHAAYARFFERGRSDFLRALGISHSALLTEDAAFAVTQLTLTFRKAARIDDALVVRTRFDAAKGARLQISQDVRRDGELLVEAAVECCCISLQGRPKRAPEALLRRLAPLLDPGASRF
jgi:acyl-CoA thioester hydrolase